MVLPKQDHRVVSLMIWTKHLPVGRGEKSVGNCCSPEKLPRAGQAFTGKVPRSNLVGMKMNE